MWGIEFLPLLVSSKGPANVRIGFVREFMYGNLIAVWIGEFNFTHAEMNHGWRVERHVAFGQVGHVRIKIINEK